MVFSEPTFLFLFLPLVVLGYFVVPPGRARNALLLAASLFFYAWGEEVFILVLLASIAINYLAGLGIAGASGRARTVALAFGVAGNLGLLAYFKYFGFLLESLGVPGAAEIAPRLPIGISFFTFQALSYLIDLHRGEIGVQRNPFRLALFISMFPQLVAGPIVRYAEVEAALARRVTTRADIAAGSERFVRGLAKKVLIADPLGLVADRIYAIPPEGLSPETAWLGATAYALQLFFDFSAYSDMAIGLGRIFGFRFPENFNFPYIARSVTEFWRRWHMTLSRWFRDYLYIPLGGNRHGALRTYVNLGIVFLATGLWHGAAWAFVLWGAYHGAFLILERLGLGRLLAALPRPISHVYLLLVVVLGWVPFRAVDLGLTLDIWQSMLLGVHGAEAFAHPVWRYLDAYVITVMAVGVAFSTPLPARAWARATEALPALSLVWTWGLFLAALVTLGAASYSPFIYFRF